MEKVLTNKILLIQFVSLAGIAFLAPFLGHQILTGTIVNAVLFTTVSLLGIQAALIVSFMPSMIALLVGVLPVFLAPMIPYIIISNMILVVSFHYLKERYWLAIIVSSFLKFSFLFLSSFAIINLFLSNNQVPLIMSWNQLFTALAGGALFLIWKSIKTKIS